MFKNINKFLYNCLIKESPILYIFISAVSVIDELRRTTYLDLFVLLLSAIHNPNNVSTPPSLWSY